MLNRRTLRIKVMQSFYAYRLCQKANRSLSESLIRERFSPDLNSMEVQDTEALKENQKEAIVAFRYRFENHKNKEGSKEILNVVDEAMEEYNSANKKDFRKVKTQMLDEVDKIIQRYYMVLQLLTKWSGLSRLDAEKKKEKRREYSFNFAENVLISKIEELKMPESWGAHDSMIKSWYKEIVRKNENFESYQRLENPGFEDDKGLLEYLIKSIIFKNDSIQAHFEEIDLNWQENKDIVKSLSRKSIKNTEENVDVKLLELSFNWEEDKEFFIDLFQITGDHDEEFEEMISSRSHNWDIERVASIDKIILKLAICEMMNFPSIPVKVTINEYIEIAKQYSTPKSRNFINGILDVLAEDLKKDGKIRKSGRGLIDNK